MLLRIAYILILVISSTSTAFGALDVVGPDYVSVGEGGSAVDQIVITNLNSRPLSVEDVSLDPEGISPSLVTLSTDCKSLLPLEECRISIAYSPVVQGSGYAYVSVTSDDPDRPVVRHMVQFTSFARGKSLFLPPKYLKKFAGRYIDGVTVGDVNSDSRDDVVVATSYGWRTSIEVLLQQENGELTDPVEYYLGEYPPSGKTLLVADLNNDGRNDVAFGRYQHLDVLYQDDQGWLASARHFSVGNASPLVAGDFDGDGLTDLALSQYNAIQIMRQNAEGGLDTAAAYPAETYVQSLAALDVDGDTRTDIVVNANRILYQTDSGTFKPSEEVAGAGTGIAVGDFNADGTTDVVSVALPPVIAGEGNRAIKYLVYEEGIAADFDRSGRISVVADNLANTVYRQKDNGSYIVEKADPYANPYGYYLPEAAGDINGDGWKDVVTFSGDSIILIYNRDPSREIVASPPALSFGTVKTGNSSSRSVILKNNGWFDATVDQLKIVVDAYTPPADFTLRNDTCSGSVIPREGTCSVDVVYTSSASGSLSYHATLTTESGIFQASLIGLNAPNRHIITTTGNVTCGTVPWDMGNLKHFHGTDITCTIDPTNYMFHIKDVLVDGVSVGAVRKYRFTALSANHHVEVVSDFNIVVEAGPGGRVIAEYPSYTFVPEAGYVVADVKIDDLSLGPVHTHVFRATAAADQHTLKVSFAPAPAAGPYAFIPLLGSNTITVVDTGSGQAVTTLPAPQRPVAVAFAARGKKAYVAGDVGEAAVIDTIKNMVSATLTIPKGAQSMASAPDGSRVFLAASDQSTGRDVVAAIDTAMDKVVATVELFGGVTGIAVSPDGESLFVSNTAAHTVTALSAENLVVKNVIKVGKEPLGLAVSPDGRTLVVANYKDGSLSIVETGTGKVLKTMKNIGKNPVSAAFNPKGDRVYVSAATGGYVSVVDVDRRSIVDRVKTGKGVTGIAVDAAGRVSVINTAKGSLSVIDPGTHRTVASIPVGESPVGLSGFVNRDIVGISVEAKGAQIGLTTIGAESIIDVTISNFLSRDLAVTGISFSGPAAADLHVDSGTCGSMSPILAPGGNCIMKIGFIPTAKGRKAAEISIYSDDADTPVVVVPVRAEVRKAPR